MKKVAILLSLVAFLAVSCEQQEVPPPMPKVSFTPCKQEVLRSSELSDKVDVEFTNKGVQITYNNFEVTCDFTDVKVTHTFENGVLSIIQQGTPNQANCICHTDVSYTIDGITQNEVNVIFINGVQVYCHNENYPIEVPFTEYSIWKYADNSGIVIELTFYPENKIHIQSTPEELGYPYLMGGNIIVDYYIRNDKMYWNNLNNDERFNGQFFWNITYLSENEMTLVYGNILPAIPYIITYHFIRQPD